MKNKDYIIEDITSLRKGDCFRFSKQGPTYIFLGYNRNYTKVLYKKVRYREFSKIKS